MKFFCKIIFTLTATLALVSAPTKGTQFCIQLLKNYTGVVDDIDNKPKENVKTLLNNWDEKDIIESAENIADENVRKLFEDIISYYNGAIWFFLNPLPPSLTRNNYCDTKSDSLRWDRETEDMFRRYRERNIDDFLRWDRETEDLLRRDREMLMEERYRRYRENETKDLKENEKTKCLEDLKKFGEDIHQTFSFALFKTKPSRYSDPNHYALSLLKDIYNYIVQNDVIGPDFMLNIKTLCEGQIIENRANMKPQMKTNKFYESDCQTVSLGWLRQDSKPHLEDIKYD